jgi:hypothetical protein
MAITAERLKIQFPDIKAITKRIFRRFYVETDTNPIASSRAALQAQFEANTVKTRRRGAYTGYDWIETESGAVVQASSIQFLRRLDADNK